MMYEDYWNSIILLALKRNWQVSNPLAPWRQCTRFIIPCRRELENLGPTPSRGWNNEWSPMVSMIFDSAGPCHKRIQSHHWVIVAGLFQERQQRQHMYLLWPDSHLHKNLCPSLSSQTFTPNVAVSDARCSTAAWDAIISISGWILQECKNKPHAHWSSHTATNILQ